MSEDSIGKNAKKIPLIETFGPTIQGEGVMIGTQTYFMRFGLCDYKCTMCDSLHAVTPSEVKKNAQWLTQADITWQFLEEKYIPNSTEWITFSGGNPCIHDLTDLVMALKGYLFKINVETQGTFCPDWLEHVDVVTCSPKGPGMGEKLELDKLDNFLTKVDAWQVDYCMKVVVFDQRDLEVARMLYERYHDMMVNDQFYLSLGNTLPPGIGDDVTHEVMMGTMLNNYRILFDDIQKDRVLSKFSFLPQWHTFVWGNAKGR